MTTRREFLLSSAAFAATTTLGAKAFAQGAGGLTQSGLVGKLEGSTVVTDVMPKAFKEAPELAALVQQGKLPPVASACRRSRW